MIYLNNFGTHTSYEEKLNRGGLVNISLPNVSYCEDVKDVHFNPYNLIEFYVGNITGTTQQTVKIYTDTTNHLDVTVSDGNKWYSYLLPKDKGLFRIEGDSVKKVIIKADINTNGITIIPNLVVEASFKGSNTSNVTSMTNMFEDCVGLKELDVSSFNTSKVTNMNYMFFRCTSLTSLDVSSFNTSNVSGMTSMFGGCNSLTSLTLSSFDTSNVTGMTSMFGDCTSLTSLDLSKWDTSKVTDMNSMFSGCNGLTSLDLSKWDTSKVIDMGSMFDSCSNSLKIKMIGCKQSTIDKIKAQLKADGITGATITTK